MNMTSFKDKWAAAVKQKNSLLCVGIDPQDRDDKLQWCISIINAVAPHTSAVKVNRNYILDLSRKETQELVNNIHKQNMIAIMDNKLSDIGSTNDAGFHHAAIEGFDAVTVSPFPGNIEEATAQAHAHNLGIIFLVLMSNPEYTMMKTATIDEKKVYEHIAQQIKKCSADGIVIGAPSQTNHISVEEIKEVKRIIHDCCILVPGIGAQGGDIKPLIELFSDNVIANVGRVIINAANPENEAKRYKEMLNRLRAEMMNT